LGSVGRNPLFCGLGDRRIDRLLPGMCFTVEPMINAGARYTRLDKADGWTVRTKDGSLSAQFEHTIVVWSDGAEILTVPSKV
jgi:methionyl aminopeptidase